MVLSFIMHVYNRLFTSPTIRENKMAINYVKIKIVSLAAEAQLIRSEERRVKRRARNNPKRSPGDLPPDVFFGLKHHRRWDVRNEARSAQLAYAFLRGVPYEKVEAAPKGTNRNTPPQHIFNRVVAIAHKYGEERSGPAVSAAVDNWLKG